MADMDQKSLQFHIQQNDYFGTLATVLDLLSQDLANQGYFRHEGTLRRVRDDLLYLQHSHQLAKITPTNES
jgi:hypothetical protein